MQKHDFFEELGRQRLVELWEAAIGAPAAPAEQTATAIQFFDKPPGADKDTPVHQDGGFTVPHITNGCTELAQVTLLLDDMDADNGALRFVHGSHREGLRPHGEGVVNIARPATPPGALAQHTPPPLAMSRRSAACRRQSSPAPASSPCRSRHSPIGSRSQSYGGGGRWWC